MSRFSSVLLILIAFTLLGQTAVTAFAPELARFALASAAKPSAWSEETSEEDESGEEDKAFGGMSLWSGSPADGSLPCVDRPHDVRDQSPEIFVPPPQG